MDPHTQTTYIYLVAMSLGEISQMFARQRETSQVDNKRINKFIPRKELHVNEIDFKSMHII